MDSRIYGRISKDHTNNNNSSKLSSKSQNIGIQDTAINALWSVDDEKLVDEEIRQMRAGNTTLQSFQEKLLKIYDDHRNITFTNTNKPFEPLKVPPPANDLVGLLGMNHLCKLATGRTNRAFTHYAAGTGTTAEHLSDSRLVSEIARVSMITDGYAEDTGTAMRFLGKYSTTLGNATIAEGAVFESGAGGVPLFRTVFEPEQRIPHMQYRDFFSLSQTVSFISVT